MTNLLPRYRKSGNKYRRGFFFMKKIYKSDTDKKIFGVCGGLAEYVGIDSTVVRIIYLVITFFTGFLPGTILYFLLAFLAIPSKEEIPKEKGDI
jgi:phage shock protein C